MRHFLRMIRHYLSWYFKHYLRTNGRRERRRKIKIETFSLDLDFYFDLNLYGELPYPGSRSRIWIQDPDL